MPWSGHCFQPEEAWGDSPQFDLLRVFRPFAFRSRLIRILIRGKVLFCYADLLSCLSFSRRFLEFFRVASPPASNGFRRASEKTHG